MIDKHPVSCKTIGLFYQLEGKRLEEQYVRHLSDFMTWSEREHASEWLLFADNIGPYLSIDETSLSQGELYTIITNKEARGKKGALVAIIKGVQSDQIIRVLEKIPRHKRNRVQEVTLDLAPTMERIVTGSFPKARLVSDRFHVQQLATDAVQQLRVEYRWQAIDQENQEIELAREVGKKHVPDILENGDTKKQLLARSRYLLFKDETKWTALNIIVPKSFSAHILLWKRPTGSAESSHISSPQQKKRAWDLPVWQSGTTR